MNTAPPRSRQVPHRPLRADAERNRRRLIEAARELFAQKGVGVTLDDVARHAGVGVGTAYRRFANRDELIEAVLEEGVQHIVELAEQALSVDDPWAGLEQFFWSASQNFAADRGLREVVLQRPLLNEQGTTSARERLTPAVSALIARTQASGQLRSGIQATDFPLIQLMLGAVSQHAHDTAPDLWQRYLRLILDGLRPSSPETPPLAPDALTPTQFDQTMTRGG
ncbi:TetR/AcrR family transcriptional regulator [Zhihengliuella halotolerans]|uniref:TetR/AcrR family transcriptional regulator n=1 Tax=Zhihengliuella halotolerans TaxID=370736 RepID=UPI000C80074E|nr:TetR/AcrR family transcriptional regulator [Zhihengliuella halotolerans]